MAMTIAGMIRTGWAQRDTPYGKVLLCKAAEELHLAANYNYQGIFEAFRRQVPTLSLEEFEELMQELDEGPG